MFSRDSRKYSWYFKTEETVYIELVTNVLDRQREEMCDGHHDTSYKERLVAPAAGSAVGKQSPAVSLFGACLSTLAKVTPSWSTILAHCWITDGPYNTPDLPVGLLRLH